MVRSAGLCVAVPFFKELQVEVTSCKPVKRESGAADSSLLCLQFDVRSSRHPTQSKNNDYDHQPYRGSW